MSWLIFASLSEFFAALTAILAKIGVKDVNSNLATAIRTIVILLFAWGIVLAQETVKQLSSISRLSLLFLILSGIATGLSWLFYFRALQLGEASRVSPIDTFDGAKRRSVSTLSKVERVDKLS
jgi:transporter family protein